MMGLKVSTFGQQMEKMRFSPHQILDGTDRNTPQDIIKTYHVKWQNFVKIGRGTSKIRFRFKNMKPECPTYIIDL